MTEKILVDKNEDLAVVSARVFASHADEIILVLPKSSKLSESAENFKFLKKGLANSNKKFSVESVDESAIKLAKGVDVPAQNPFFNQPAQSLESLESPASQKPDDDYFSNLERDLEKAFPPASPKYKERPNLGKKAFIGSTVLVSLLAGAFLLGFKVLPQASISISAEQLNWEYEGKVVVDKNAVAGDSEKFIIPGQDFIIEKNSQFTFPASSKKLVEQKAKGTILIYNAYSSDDQPLVATTRFQTEDGKIVRLDKAVVVPGAKIIDGKIEPSVITAEVTADKPGELYNIGPVKKLNVPGFKGSPKHLGFYGEIKDPLSGGFAGERAYPTDQDIAKAKEESAVMIKDSLTLAAVSQVPSDFKALEGSRQFSEVTTKVDTNVNEKGEFSVFTQGKLSIIGFRENDLLAVFENKMKTSFDNEVETRSYDLNYDFAKVAREKDKVSFSVEFSAVANRVIDTGGLQQKIAGKSKSELRALLFSIPGLKEASISFWPFWVNNAPKNSDKIEINVD